MTLSKEELLDMYLQMLQIRTVDEKIAVLIRNNLMRGFSHQCVGQEATAVGVCKALRKSDFIATTHRGHGHSLAKSRNIKGILAELLARQTGFCHGKGGSMHLADTATGNLGANGIVAGGMPLAVGAALSMKYQGLDQVVVSFFGDAATNQGLFHESVNFAAVNNLPILFACENNMYGFSVPYKSAIRVEHISERAAAYGIKGITVDGNDVLTVYETAKTEVDAIRKGGGPVLVEFLTYRWKGHSINDPGDYKEKEEQKYWLERCPIKRFHQVLLDQGFGEEELAAVQEEAANSFEEALQYAMQSPYPDVKTALEDVYA